MIELKQNAIKRLLSIQAMCDRIAEGASVHDSIATELERISASVETIKEILSYE